MYWSCVLSFILICVLILCFDLHPNMCTDPVFWSSSQYVYWSRVLIIILICVLIMLFDFHPMYWSHASIVILICVLIMSFDHHPSMCTDHVFWSSSSYVYWSCVLIVILIWPPWLAGHVKHEESISLLLVYFKSETSTRFHKSWEHRCVIWDAGTSKCNILLTII